MATDLCLLPIPAVVKRIVTYDLKSKGMNIMARRGMRFGIFLAPFHAVGENPTLSMDRDMELIEWLDHLGYEKLGSANTILQAGKPSLLQRYLLVPQSREQKIFALVQA